MIEIENRVVIEVKETETIIVERETQRVIEISDSGISANNREYKRKITNADLTNERITLEHGLGISPSAVMISNNVNFDIKPSDIESLNSNSVRISLEGYAPIIGEWEIRII